MGLKKILFTYLLISGAVLVFSQANNQPNSYSEDTATANRLINEAVAAIGVDLGQADSLNTIALEISEKNNYLLGIAKAKKNFGLIKINEGKFLETLDYFTESLNKYIELKDNSGIANLYSNIGAIYYNRGDDTKALENYLQSLKYAEDANDKYRVFIALNNIGGVYNIKAATVDKALEYYLRALKICEELDSKKEMGVICVNIGNIYADKDNDTTALFYFDKALNAYGATEEGSQNVYNSLGKLYMKEEEYDKAIDNHLKALRISERISDQLSIVQSEIGLGNAYQGKGDFRGAVDHYKRAESLAKEIGANHELQGLYHQMSQNFAMLKDYQKAFNYQRLYSSVKDTIYNIETDKKLGSLQFEFDLEKKQNQINLLTKDKDLQEVKIKRQRLAKNAFMVGLLLAFIIALLIYRGYRNKVKTHKILDKQKNQIEDLLLNILPKQVANELQTTGHATPRHYESVSVMFTDFKGFTIIADKMSPDELVKELDACFIAFDAIIGKFQLEKIKTIGDSYMCAGGIPTPETDHVLRIVKAGLEIQKYVADYNVKRSEKGLEPWDVRIGIHVGPVVAGVVGQKKYAYDIWGSTVNIASRMESNGEPGRVNISAATYELIKNYYACSYRGKIYAKNVGDIDMYFIDQEYKVPLNLVMSEQEELND